MRSLLAVVLGAIVAVLIALGVTAIIDHTKIPDWIDYLVWLAALVGWIVWSFPAYFGGGPRRV